MTMETKNMPQQETNQPAAKGIVYRPNVDILESEHELTLVADLPGVDRESLDINFEDGLLTIQAQVAPRYGENQKFMLREYGIGNFYRSFHVSDQINVEGIRADYAEGVLRVHLPKAEAAKPRKIAVNTAG